MRQNVWAKRQIGRKIAIASPAVASLHSLWAYIVIHKYVMYLMLHNCYYNDSFVVHIGVKVSHIRDVCCGWQARGPRWVVIRCVIKLHIYIVVILFGDAACEGVIAKESTFWAGTVEPTRFYFRTFLGRREDAEPANKCQFSECNRCMNWRNIFIFCEK